MGLFEQFPFTNFHQLNLDWIIQELKKRGENMVLSVNGETGDVVLYKSENIVFPSVDADTWRMVRVADGHTAGVMFQNGLMYVMFDNTAERVYTVDHPPTYPVTSVDGQTGAVRVFPDAATRLPDVTADKTNIRRQIRDNGTDHIVGIEIDKDKATRMDDNHRYKIYDEGNTPDIVTSVNGASGAVIIAVPFEDTQTANILFADAASGHEWSLGRETADGVASIQVETDSSSASAYIHFFTDDPAVTYTKKLLTIDDIPSTSGVVSFNGQTGVVTAYGDTLPIESGAARSVKEYADDISSGLGYVELTNTATHNIPEGSFVVWKGVLYTARTTITIGDTLSASNLLASSVGGLNDLLENKAVYKTTTWVPSINGVTYSDLEDNIAVRLGDVVFCSAVFTVASAQAVSAYINGSSLPTFPDKQQHHGCGTWHDFSLDNAGEISSSSNMNMWLFNSATGAHMNMTTRVGSRIYINFWFLLI